MKKPPFVIGLQLNYSPNEPFRMLCMPTQKDHAEAIHTAILETLPALQKRFIWAENTPTLEMMKGQVNTWHESYNKDIPQKWDRYVWMILSETNFNSHTLEFNSESSIPDEQFHLMNLSGIISLTRIEEDKDAYEFGYWIREGHQRQNIISDAIQGLITNVEADYFRIRYAKDNAASKAIAAKFGFEYSYTEKDALKWQDGRTKDMLVFTLKR
jgi:RimJ/RimL family protein N-acetyltransferase